MNILLQIDGIDCRLKRKRREVLFKQSVREIKRKFDWEKNMELIEFYFIFFLILI